jgi:hypothetical protein
MRKFSESEIAKIVVGTVLILWIIALCFIIANHTISCVDKNGCLKSFCDINWFRSEYKDLIKANAQNCP